MRQALLGALLLSFVAGGCRHTADVAKGSTQDNFGVQMARSNLWREAMFRFRRAVELNPQDAMAHNNLAVALEANGDYDTAAKEYREALRLDRSNQYIQKNYSRFVEFLSRNKKRQQRQSATASTATAPPATTPPPPPVTPPPAPSPAPTPNPPRGGSR